jgi:oligosaccharide repeat unit polymerase
MFKRRYPVGAILQIPSFWGALTWVAAFGLYLLRLLSWDSPSAAALLVFSFVGIAFVASTLVFEESYVIVRDSSAHFTNSETPTRRYSLQLLALHALGFAGIALYVRDLARVLGGWQVFTAALLYGSQYIRWALEDSVSFGTQISYFGWIAIALTVIHLRRNKASRWWLLLVFAQVLGNLLFVDRTRPTWIGLTTIAVVLIDVRDLSFHRLARWILIVCATFIALFLAIAQWLGKNPEAGAYGHSVLPLPLQSMYLYTTAGFAYFNEILHKLAPAQFETQRTLYPAWKVLARLGLAKEPVSQVNEIYWVPFPVNVGTFLEPWYRDGGFALAGIGLFVHTVLANWLGLILLRAGTPLARFAWANLCFMCFIAFFTPKATTLPLWMFVGIGVFEVAAFNALGRKLTSRPGASGPRALQGLL